MENEIIIPALVIAFFSAILFLGSSITGNFIANVEPDVICDTEVGCPENECCIVYPDYNVGLCMDICQSKEFLCKNSAECEEGNVCCITEGMDYGICNYADKCMSINAFADLVKKTPTQEKPASVSSGLKDKIILFQSVLIIALVLIIVFFFAKKGKK